MQKSITNTVIIFGSSETASLAKYYLSKDSDFQVIAFTVDDEFVKNDKFDGLPVIPFSELIKKYKPEQTNMHVALSYTKLNNFRNQKYDQVKKYGYKLINYISSKATYWPDLKIGDNCFILENQTIQPSVTIGNNVMIWSGNHIGHGSEIGDHTYVSSHVVIAGHCKIGKRCFLGINSTIKDFTVINDDVFISMGANVTSNISSGSVVLSRKSEVYKEEEKISKIIKKKNFGV